MNEKRKLEFFLLRYVPDAVKEEFVNIGLVVVEPDGGFREVRFTHDWRRVQCMDGDADLEVIQALEADIQKELTENPATLMKRLEESFSGMVQISPWKSCVTADPAKEMEVLESLYLESIHLARERRTSSRQQIYQAMEEAFRAANVLKQMKRGVDLAQYTWANDPMKIDFAYEAQATLKMFQAVSLTGSADAALVLAFRYPKIQSALENQGLGAELTAVVGERGSKEMEYVDLAFKVLEENQVRIATVSEMDKIAEQARIELRA